MREKLLIKLAHWHAAYPGRMLLIVFLLTLLFGFFAGHLKVTMRWSDLLPSKDRRTIEFNKIIDEFVSATSLVVVVQGEEKRIKEFADILAPRILETVDTNNNGENLFRRVDYKTEIDFLKKHGLILIKEEDLRNLKDIFMDPNLTGLLVNLNNSMEKEYVGQEESISTREKEDSAVVFLDGVESLIEGLKSAARGENLAESDVRNVADKLLFGEPYLLSYDEKALILNAVPNFTMMDTDLMVLGTDSVQEILEEMQADYPDVKAGLTGMIAIGRDEMVYSEQSLGYTTVIAVVAILILLMLSFRMWIAPVLAIVNLLVGLIWAVGVAAIVVGQLNIMTIMMAVILLGLGIDFSIHLISGFTERRAAGDAISEAMERTFVKSGKGILTGGVTTACAFLTMAISQSRGLKEMGIVTGSGLLAILIATFLFLPSLLVVRERRFDKKRDKKDNTEPFVQRDITFRFLGQTAEWLGKHYIFAILFSLIATLVFAWSGSKITFDHNYMNIEPKGLTSVELQDVVLEKFDLSMDYALILADNIDESRQLAEACKDLGSVAIAEDISFYFPSSGQQQQRKQHLQNIVEKMRAAAIRDTIVQYDLQSLYEEVERLEMNIMEIQDMAYLGGQDKVDNKCKAIVGDPERTDSRNIIQELLRIFEANEPSLLFGLSGFQKRFAPYFKRSVIGMASTDPIELEDLPVSLLDRYSNTKRDQFLVTVFPKGNIWQDAAFLHRFDNDLERVSDKATGMPPVFRALIEIIGHDGRNAVFLTLVIVFFLLLADFRSPVYSLMAMIPLACGVLWMVGLMKLTGQQLTVMNIMGLPMIVGIGIDDGVHIIHRWRQEGKRKIDTVFASTGKAILLTSLTTMLAFGSLVFAIWRGFGHLGAALFLGVGACFLTTVLILPGIIGFIERKRK
ncbi:MAG: MMPL family transporter [Candidatus Aminicenantes bacterium]|jgi:predicted RND superfamily exporter protein